MIKSIREIAKRIALHNSLFIAVNQLELKFPTTSLLLCPESMRGPKYNGT